MADFLSSIFGSKPSVPPWMPISLGGSQQTAIKSNQAALPAAETLTATTNAFTEQQITQMLEQAIPGYDAMAAQSSKNIGSLLKGEIPTDVAVAVQNSAAARSLTGGFGGSGLAGNLTARDLGLTSLDLMGTGFSMEQSWMNLANSIYAPHMMSVASMFISPEQQFQADVLNEQMQVEQQWLQNQVDAMPDPVVSSLTRLGMSAFGTVLGASLASQSGGSVGEQVQGAQAGSAIGTNAIPQSQPIQSAGGGDNIMSGSPTSGTADNGWFSFGGYA